MTSAILVTFTFSPASYKAFSTSLAGQGAGNIGGTSPDNGCEKNVPTP